MPDCRATAAGHSVTDILKRFYPAYLQRYAPDDIQRSALQSILLCRTEAMGGHHYCCTHCKEQHFAWHSCNHRLCPQCGADDTARWVEQRLEERLAIDHYLVTFTLPESLRKLSQRYGAAFYRIFFRASSQAIKDVLADPRHLGGRCGFTGVFQSWTQDLCLHPHIHYIVPGAGVDKQGKLIKLKRKGWLARGDVFAARLKTLLLEALQELSDAASWINTQDRSKAWVCDVQNFGNGSNAIKYLGAYLFKGPIADKRILRADAKHVWISVKDRKKRCLKTVRIEGVEFVRRYLQHALPSGFHRIRYYGFMHPTNRKLLHLMREQLGQKTPKQPKDKNHTEKPGYLCPQCGLPMQSIQHRTRAPPWQRRITQLWQRNTQAA